MKILILATRFPNTIQPWLANSIAQTVVNGYDVEILSARKGDTVYAEVVDEYELVKKTHVVPTTGLCVVISALRNIVNLSLILKTVRGYGSCKERDGFDSILIKRVIRKIVLAPWFLRGDIDIVHSHFEVTGYLYLPIVRCLGVPFVITFHGLPPPGVSVLPDIRRKVYTDNADVILVNTEFAKKQYADLGVDESRIRILPQGTDTSVFKFKRKVYSKELPLILLTIGRLSKDKGHIYAFHAVKKLRSKGINLIYKIVGQGPEAEMLYKLAKQLEIDDVVYFEESLPEKELVLRYQEAHIFILPSLRSIDGYHEETQGVVLQEAQSCGALVIATRVGGIPECVDDGVNAFLVPDKDSEAIAKKIEWLVENNKNWNYWQDVARKHVEEKYEISVIGKRLAAIYKDVIARRD